jgi:uncharacterized heparinase superfamily protein
MTVSTARRYWETLRHLKVRQVLGRVRFAATTPHVGMGPAPGRRALAADRWVMPARRAACLVGDRTFRLLGRTRSLEEHGWDDPSVERLWRYHLHYFDDLNAESATARRDAHTALIDEWIATNPLTAGTGWEPYPTSLRLVNWIKWCLSGHELSPRAEHSLAVQARWLERRLEWHLLGNHLFANAKALIFAGLFFDGPEATRWLTTGMRVLTEQIPEQILEDGGHFERSPMYHALALEDLLDLVNLSQCPVARPDGGAMPPPEWRSRVPAMRAWLRAMCHPDGEIAFFNDAAIEIAPAPRELDRYAEALGFPPVTPASPAMLRLEPSGYVRLARGLAVAMLDVGIVGPDYLPGHAHADTLSFELSVFGRRVLSNSGTSTYESGAERQRQRGTAAHNTVIVDDEDSSEVWAAFRVARRARPSAVVVNEGAWSSVACSHDGYTRLPGRPVHHREWQLDEGALVVADHVSGTFGHAVARFHFHPTATPRAGDDPRTGTVTIPGCPPVTWRVEAGRAVLEPATSHPRFGESEPTTCLAVRLTDARSRVRFTWAQAPCTSSS